LPFVISDFGCEQVAAQVALDNFAIQPLIYWPVYYLFKETITGLDSNRSSKQYSSERKSHERSSSKQLEPLVSKPVEGKMPEGIEAKWWYSFEESVSRAKSNHRKNIVNDTFGMAMFWIPCHTLCYSVPMHWRLPVMHSLSFVWVGILSYARGARTPRIDTYTAE
jgi:hypothetical protein